MVTTKELGVIYYAGISTKQPPGKGTVKNKAWADWFNRYGINEGTGGPLDGYFPSSRTIRVAELMAGAASLRVPGNESIGVTPCRVVEAKTRYGTYRMWIAESMGYIPLKVSYEIGPDDFHGYGDGRRFSEVTIPSRDGQNLPGSRASGLLDEVTVERIGEAFIPVAGRFSKTEWYSHVCVFTVNSYTRTAIDLRPGFEGTDAFVTDLPEGTIIQNEADPSSGVRYEWRGGKAVPAGVAFGGSPAVPSWGERTSVPQFLWGALGLVLFGAGLGIARHGKG
jgi:hypothetical protein